MTKRKKKVKQVLIWKQPLKHQLALIHRPYIGKKFSLRYKYAWYLCQMHTCKNTQTDTHTYISYFFDNAMVRFEHIEIFKNYINAYHLENIFPIRVSMKRQFIPIHKSLLLSWMQIIFSSLNFIQLVPVNKSKFYSWHHKSHYRKCNVSNDHMRGKKWIFFQ